ncbi:hypothetical protein C0J52_05306 [Blattella germanica]|nr:hypothetical protein C0J52_05306 [Blattella germanica]
MHDDVISLSEIFFLVCPVRFCSNLTWKFYLHLHLFVRTLAVSIKQLQPQPVGHTVSDSNQDIMCSLLVLPKSMPEQDHDDQLKLLQQNFDDTCQEDHGSQTYAKTDKLSNK